VAGLLGVVTSTPREPDRLTRLVSRLSANRRSDSPLPQLPISSIAANAGVLPHEDAKSLEITSSAAPVRPDTTR